MRYFIYKDADLTGPYDSNDLRRLNADPDTLVYSESSPSGGRGSWRLLSEVLDLSADSLSGRPGLPPIPEKSVDELIVDFDLDLDLLAENDPALAGEFNWDALLDLAALPDISQQARDIPMALAAQESAPEIARFEETPVDALASALAKLGERLAALERTPESQAQIQEKTLAEFARENSLLDAVARLGERLARLEQRTEHESSSREQALAEASRGKSLLDAVAKIGEQISALERRSETLATKPPAEEPKRSSPPAQDAKDFAGIIFEAPKTFPLLNPPEQEEPQAASLPPQAMMPETKSPSLADTEPAPEPAFQAAAPAELPVIQPAATAAEMEKTGPATAQNPEPPPTPAPEPGSFEAELQKTLGPSPEVSAFNPVTAPEPEAVLPSLEAAPQEQANAGLSLFAATPGGGFSTSAAAPEISGGVFGAATPLPAADPIEQGLGAEPQEQAFGPAPAASISTHDLVSELAQSAQAEPAKTQVPAPKAKKESSRAAYVLSGALVIAAAGGAGFFLWNGGSQHSAPPLSSAPAPAAAPASPAVPPQAQALTPMAGQPGPMNTQAQPQEPLPAAAPVSPEAQAAIDLVNNYPLDGNRGTVAQWLQYSFTANPGDDNKVEWTAVALNGASYEVTCQVVPGPRSSMTLPISYLFTADAVRQTVQGSNAAAKQLLVGGATPEAASPAQADSTPATQ